MLPHGLDRAAAHAVGRRDRRREIHRGTRLTIDSRPAADRPPRSTQFRFVQLILGLFGWALAIALFIRSHLGLGPWDAFHYGLHLRTGMTVGTASITAGLVIVLCNLRLGVRPGLGTVLNMILIGVFTDLLLPVIPDATSLLTAWGFFMLGIPITGIASGMYIGARFGQGPRDGLMMALSARTGWSIRSIRLLIEVTVLAAGWLLGGTIGIGTVIYTLTIGHAVQWGFRLFGIQPPPPRAVGAVS